MVPYAKAFRGFLTASTTMQQSNCGHSRNSVTCKEAKTCLRVPLEKLRHRLVPKGNDRHEAQQVEDHPKEVQEEVLDVHTGVHALLQRHLTVD